MNEDKTRRRSIYCPVVETQAAMHERAREANMALSRLVVEFSRADDPDGHPLVLTEAEQKAMRDELGECADLTRGHARRRRVAAIPTRAQAMCSDSLRRE